jgi:hypothetical protein
MSRVTSAYFATLVAASLALLTVVGALNPIAYCTSDADCVPVGCCHPTECAARRVTDNSWCSGQICTDECRWGTLDCGLAACRCETATTSCIVVQSREQANAPPPPPPPSTPLPSFAPGRSLVGSFALLALLAVAFIIAN